MELKVVKRDGRVEDYEPEKILRVVKAAGLTEDEAQKLLDAVNKTLKEKNKSQYTSVQIRDLIIVEMQRLNKTVANKFIWYEKLRDKNS